MEVASVCRAVSSPYSFHLQWGCFQFKFTSLHPFILLHQPECCCGDAVDDDKDSVDDEVGQLDDTRGTSESEDEVPLRVVRVQHSHCPAVVEFLTYVAFHENKNVPSLNL